MLTLHKQQDKSAIDLPSMPDLYNLNETGGIVNAVDNAVITLPNAIAFRFA